jgi:ABC-type uncharacterized transport system permease subunit
MFTLSAAGVAILGHSLAINHLIFASEINFALSNVVSLVNLIITVAITIIALKYRINLLLPVAYGFACFWQLLSLLVPSIHEVPLAVDDPYIYSHITLSLLAYCILVIATMYAFQVAYINHKLKEKNLLAVSHLPPLMQVESQLFIILAIGTLCLIISEVSGFLFLENLFSKENAHKTVLSLASLFVYLSILIGHYKLGWRGHRVLVLTLVGTGLLTMAYFGSRFVKEFLLS